MNMLFRTVYGPELHAIYMYFLQHQSVLSQEEIKQAFFKQDQNASFSPQSIDDGLSFLRSAHILQEKNDRYYLQEISSLPHQLLFLQQFMLLYKKDLPALHPLDPLYLLILDELFIKRNIVYIEKLHTEVNALRAVKQLGGLNQEKLQAWRRVMAYLGVGHRVGSGFYCMYRPDLLMDIFLTYHWSTNALQPFFETYFDTFLPYKTIRHDLAQAVATPLIMLHEKGQIVLHSLQDAPQRAYLGTKQIQYITMCHDNERKSP